MIGKDGKKSMGQETSDEAIVQRPKQERRAKKRKYQGRGVVAIELEAIEDALRSLSDIPSFGFSRLLGFSTAYNLALFTTSIANAFPPLRCATFVIGKRKGRAGPL